VRLAILCILDVYYITSLKQIEHFIQS